MVEYLRWCIWLRSFFMGDHEGKPVYLSVDNSLLEAIARTKLPQEDIVEHFLGAVRRAFGGGNRLDLDAALRLRTHDTIGVLAFLVLAAYQMEPDDDLNVAGTNYSVRLRSLLNIPASLTDQQIGYDRLKIEQLWRRFSEWLLAQNAVPTVRLDGDHQRYLHMALSQVTFRAGDREKIRERLGKDREAVAGEWDRDRLSVWFRRDGPTMGSHCRDLAAERDLTRYAEIVEQLYGIASELDGREEGSVARSIGAARIQAGIYLDEDPFGGGFTYRLFPSRPPRTGPPLEVCIQKTVEEEWERLDVLGNSHFAPIFEIGDLGSGGSWKATRGGCKTTIELPARDFWILIRDPADPEGGAWGTWGRPAAGEHFRLLIRESEPMRATMDLWRKEKFLFWNGDPIPADGKSAGQGWIEYHDCQVLDLTHLNDDRAPGLHDAMLPIETESLRIAGGLRAPNSSAWLQECAPSVGVITGPQRYPFRIVLRSWSDSPERDIGEVHGQDQLLPLTGLKPGLHNVEARRSDGRLVSSRTIRIASWDLKIANGLSSVGEVV